MTADGFAFVVCHEIAHHMGGFPFYSYTSLGWAAAEGQADYWAAHTCLRTAWEGQITENLALALDRNLALQHLGLWQKCINVYQNYPLNDVALCIRIGMAGKGLADLDAQLTNRPEPKFSCPASWGPTQDCPVGHQAPNVSQTISNHPHSQCRLDTTTSAALCTMAPAVPSLRGHIAGKDMHTRLGGRNGIAAEREAAAFACNRQLGDATHSTLLPTGGQPPMSWGPWGYRPHCWFKETASVSGPFI